MILMRKATSMRQVALLLLLSFALCLPAHTAVAQSPNTFEITLEELGYDEVLMRGPLSATRYYFSLPSTWAPQEGSSLALHLSYFFTGHETDPSAFLRVILNDELLHTETLKAADDLRLFVNLPPDTLLASEDQYINTLKLEFEVDEECERALLVHLAVSNSSFLHFLYQKEPVRADLALYPAPIYQPQAFEQGGLRFILPAEPTDAELEAATMIAARLGRLTVAQLPISATLSSDLQGVMPQEHLMIIGQPDDLPLIRQLALPVSVAARQLSVSSEMPAVIEPGDVTSYTLTVVNTSNVTQSLALEDRLPTAGRLLSCSAPCTEVRPGVARWEIGVLAPGGQVSSTITLQIDPPPDPGVAAGGPLDATIEHTASLLDEQGNVLNVDTLSAQVGIPTSDQRVTSQDEQSLELAEGQRGYLFTQEGQGVAEGDGLVQEIISPWQPDRAAIVVTGLDEAALLKAARALSSDNHFPGMWGSYALVQASHPISESVTAPAENRSLASLGYQDDAIASLHLEYLEYRFQLPAGWELHDDAYLALHFAHGIALNDIEATLEVQLNGLPIGSLHLDESNTAESWMAFPLPATATQTGSNRIRIQASADNEYICQYITSERYWLTVFADSFLHLPHQAAGLVLTLDKLPYPFANNPNLEDLAFLLPEHPASSEVEGVLRLASQMGSVAGGDDFLPRVASGEQPDVESWAGHHLVILGTPTDNIYLAAANDKLPQRFRPGTNEIQQEIDRVVYRLAPGESLGFVQELPSPWDQERAVLAVTGTNKEGVAWALDALTDDQLRRMLSGNLASIRDQTVWSLDTRQTTPEEMATIAEQIRLQLVGDATPTPTATLALPSLPTTTPVQSLTTEPTQLPGATPTQLPSPTPSPTAGITPEPVPAPAESAQPTWLIPLLVASALVVVVAVGIAIWQARR